VAAIDALLFTTVVCVLVIFAAREELFESTLEVRLFIFIAIDSLALDSVAETELILLAKDALFVIILLFTPSIFAANDEESDVTVAYTL
jgi:hypothetical protein